MNTYKLTLISLLAAVCVVGRISFQFLPNVQPVTAVIIVAGASLGVVPALFIAIVSAYVTNLFMGMGIWTVWQIVAWSVIGLIAGLIGRYTPSKYHLVTLTGFSVLAAFLYGLILNLGTFTFSGSFLAYQLASLPFDLMHAIGNVFFMLILYPVLRKVFQQNIEKIEQ
ncbi:ECF transporter S component [Gracilibacillus salinarum]|uniref:ECF transporter S component n=1 Tax=Gracilibacillus salinarum TaxID=2932255 RepID=A0ABY4GNW8_9BACI|nr:ECF transporter S component [Gracilibacillus salinarum]UOQ85911.1 ECF transporter S component [Gracilibacillus salinarum]